MNTIKEFLCARIEKIKEIFASNQNKTKTIEAANVEIDEFFDGMKKSFKSMIKRLKKEEIEGYLTSSFKKIGETVGKNVKDEKLKTCEFRIDFGPIHIHSGKDKKRPLPPPPPHRLPPPPPPHRLPPPPRPPKPHHRPLRDEAKKTGCDNCNCNKKKKGCDNCNCNKNKTAKKTESKK